MNLARMKRSEDTEQINLFNWLRSEEKYQPELHWIFHVPNGGSRNEVEAKKLKAMGVLAGVPDICFPISRGKYRQLWIEMKFGDNKATPRQMLFLQKMQEQGDFVCICYSAFAAKRAIQCYMELTGEAEITEASFEDTYSYMIDPVWKIPVMK